jgi:hypothetical protein
MRSRAIAFAALAVVCVAAAVTAGALAVVGARKDRAAADRAVAADAPKAGEILSSGRPFAAFRVVDRSHASMYGRMAVAALEGGKPGTPVLAGPACARIAVGAHRGLCLDLLGTQMAVDVLDARLRTVHSFELAGIPSRARISPDGRWGGVTAFVVGHAYAAPGTFSTSTTIIDMQAGKPVADLEKDFTVTDGGKAVKARDRNYWGLTFAGDGDTFYATLATGPRTWLIKGSIKGRRAHTIHANVECPSLSPDGTRIGYKKAVSENPKQWRFTVLDLATGKETPLSETRSVDDQLAWLDDGRLLYGDGKQSWVVAADGSGSPRPWLRNADSPTVQEGTESSP